MKTTTDLDAIDRVTVRVWRAGNLAGWTALAAVLYLIPGEVFGAVSVALKGRISAVLAAPLLIAWVAFSVVGLPLLVGRLIGERVYRWPAVLAVFAVVAANVYLFGTTTDADVSFSVGWGGIGAFIAGVTAHDRWRQRPRALRGGPPR
jgi:hypothetical protein